MKKWRNSPCWRSIGSTQQLFEGCGNMVWTTGTPVTCSIYWAKFFWSLGIILPKGARFFARGWQERSFSSNRSSFKDSTAFLTSWETSSGLLWTSDLSSPSSPNCLRMFWRLLRPRLQRYTVSFLEMLDDLSPMKFFRSLQEKYKIQVVSNYYKFSFPVWSFLYVVPVVVFHAQITGDILASPSMIVHSPHIKYLVFHPVW